MTVRFQVSLESKEKFTEAELKLMRLMLDTFLSNLKVTCPAAAKSYTMVAMYADNLEITWE